MTKKLTRFYQISIWLMAILFLTTIIVKATIFLDALVEQDLSINYVAPITIFMYRPYYQTRVTTETNQKLFNKIDRLLTPAFLILFTVITVKLVNTPDIFKLKD